METLCRSIGIVALNFIRQKILNILIGRDWEVARGEWTGVVRIQYALETLLPVYWDSVRNPGKYFGMQTWNVPASRRRRRRGTRFYHTGDI